MLMTVGVFNALAVVYNLTPAEQQKILNEADDWIDEMPDGLQDRLSDAINHAERGFYSELGRFRNLADTSNRNQYQVIVNNFQGGAYSDIPMRIYRPKKMNKRPMPLLVYYHGGGWSLGNLNTSDKFCRALASYGNVLIISVDYMLAPEKPYPAGGEQAFNALSYIFSHAEQWGSRKDLISIGGDGAGGNIALYVYSRIPETVKLKSMVLYYPLLSADGKTDAQNKRAFGKGYGLDSRLLESFASAYRGKEITTGKILPPTLLIGAGRDIIISDIQDFSRQNEVTYVEMEGAIHGFITDGHQKTAFNKAVDITDMFLTD